jgi:glycosidase
VWPRELQQNTCFRRQGNPQEGGDDSTGDFQTLRQMRTDDPAVQEALIAVYEYVIARFDVDGFRIDTLRYLKGEMPRQFGNAMHEFAESIGKRNSFTFGEVLERTAEKDIPRFIGRNTLDVSNQQMVGVDAALDYPLFYALKPVVKGLAPPTNVIGVYFQRKTLEADIVSSHGDATRFFVTFLDNHDMQERIRYEALGNPTEFDDQVALGLARLFALPGIPCVYYGTEQGLHGRDARGHRCTTGAVLEQTSPGQPRPGHHAPGRGRHPVRWDDLHRGGHGPGIPSADGGSDSVVLSHSATRPTALEPTRLSSLRAPKNAAQALVT